MSVMQRGQTGRKGAPVVPPVPYAQNPGVVRLPIEQGKGPRLTGWTQPYYQPDEVPAGWNVGLRMDSLTGIDCDGDGAAEWWAQNMPATPYVSESRPGRRVYWYRDEVISPGFYRWAIEEDGPNMGEVRVGHKAQTVIPPSIHPDTGLPYRWVGEGGEPNWTDLSDMPKFPADRLPQRAATEKGKSTAVPGGWTGSPDDEVVAWIKWGMCPAGDHTSESLTLGQLADGRYVPVCHSAEKCATDAIIAALVETGELEREQLYPPEPPNILDESGDDDFLARSVTRVSEVLTRPPVEWWPGLEGLLQVGVTSEIVAASGGGKSLWTMQHCVDLAQRSVRVLYCALEGQAGFTGRLKAQIQERCIDALPGVEAALMAAMEENLLFYNLSVALSGGDVAQSVSDLRRTAEGHGVDIVVIDTLIRAAPGVDENDNAQMQGIVDSADLLRYRDGMSVWLIRHAGHGQDRGRGASSVYAALDNSVFIAPVGNHDGKDGRPLIVRVRADKIKDGRQAHGLIYRRHELVLGTLHDGTDWTSVVFRPEHGLDEDQNADWTSVLDLVDEYTDHEDGIGMTASQVRAATQWSTTKVGKVLKEMTEASKIQRSKEGKGSFVYTR